MIEFINKHQKLITQIGALSVLILCYFQEIEIRKLRNSLKKAEQTKNIVKVDSTQTNN